MVCSSMADEEDARALEARARWLWDNGALVEAAEAYEVAADLREELNLPQFEIVADRGAAKRLRVTVWAIATWPGRIANLHPENVRGARRSQSFYSIRLWVAGEPRFRWPVQLVVIDHKNRVQLATPRKVAAWRASVATHRH